MSNRNLAQNPLNRWIKCDFRTQCHQIVTNSVRFCTSLIWCNKWQGVARSVITQIGNCGRQLRHFCMLVISGLGRSRLSSGNWQNSQLADSTLFYLRPECQEEPPGCKSPVPNQSVLNTRSLQRMKRTEGYLALTQKTSLHSSL